MQHEQLCCCCCLGKSALISRAATVLLHSPVNDHKLPRFQQITGSRGTKHQVPVEDRASRQAKTIQSSDRYSEISCLFVHPIAPGKQEF